MSTGVPQICGSDKKASCINVLFFSSSFFWVPKPKLYKLCQKQWAWKSGWGKHNAIAIHQNNPVFTPEHFSFDSIHRGAELVPHMWWLQPIYPTVLAWISQWEWRGSLSCCVAKDILHFWWGPTMAIIPKMLSLISLARKLPKDGNRIVFRWLQLWQ